MGLKSAIKDQDRVIMARGWCIIGNFMSKPFCTLVASNGIISVKHFFTETSTLFTTRMQNGFEVTWHGIILTKLDRLLHINYSQFGSSASNQNFWTEFAERLHFRGRSQTVLTSFWLSNICIEQSTLNTLAACYLIKVDIFGLPTHLFV